ncbi:type II toxin-antitoxin system VapC family toxin [Leptospira levettii]|uniref:type II toxin-antitoxin system VapC family toxin n=1 Tax=Leptospira levettii TaxID=2023178 RepID=UPI0014390E13|nr:type II toxin-antitoxin system VapC family toxin [Leptospira levettii]
MRWLLDTNAIIYIQKGLVKEPLPNAEIFISVISKIELLSYPNLTSIEKNFLNDFLSNIHIIPLSPEIETLTIDMRIKHKLKIPDAIICASAILSESVLITNDLQLAQIPELKIKSLTLSP